MAAGGDHAIIQKMFLERLLSPQTYGVLASEHFGGKPR
jgi:hypothetical protein